MLSGVLRSSRAIAVNIQIMRAFNSMRKALASIAPLLARIEATDRRQIADQAKNDANQVRVGSRLTMNGAELDYCKFRASFAANQTAQDLTFTNLALDMWWESMI